jgi:hypothetical protein
LDCSSLKKKEVRQAAAKEVVVVRMTGILVHGWAHQNTTTSVPKFHKLAERRSEDPLQYWSN